nr:TPA: gp93-like protein [Oryctes rhinoceros nudivirus]
MEYWLCHLHSSSTCSLKTEPEPGSQQQQRYFHVIPIKNISVTAQSFNARKVADEFWEDFEHVLYVSPIAYASCINNYNVFNAVVSIFNQLDANNMKYSSLNTPADFVKKHIVTDGLTKICLCNKHLIKSAGKKIQQFYTRNVWIKSILKLLFPKIDATKEGIPTNTPQWAINLFAMSRGEPSAKKVRLS